MTTPRQQLGTFGERVAKAHLCQRSKFTPIPVVMVPPVVGLPGRGVV